jgi:hypothetical protein
LNGVERWRGGEESLEAVSQYSCRRMGDMVGEARIGIDREETGWISVV